MKTTLDHGALQALQEAGALRELRAIRRAPGWQLQARLATRWLDVRSRREPVRIWGSLDSLAKFCDALGVRCLSVEL